MAHPSRGVITCARSFVLVSLTLALMVAPLRGQSSALPEANPLTLYPGDVVRVEIWREDDLSGSFRVDERGIVTFPLIGPRDVRGIPVDELRDGLIEEYRAELRNPSITITPLRQVHVLGHVNAPGMYTVDPTVSLAGAIAIAGGASGDGDLRRLRIARAGTIIQDGVAAEATLQQIDIRSGDQIVVDRRAWFERNTTFIISALMSLTSIVISFTR